MAAFADQVESIMRLDPECDARSDDRDAFDIDRHRHSGRRSSQMADVDMDAEAAFAGIKMRRQ